MVGKGWWWSTGEPWQPRCMVRERKAGQCRQERGQHRQERGQRGAPSAAAPGCRGVPAVTLPGPGQVSSRPVTLQMPKDSDSAWQCPRLHLRTLCLPVFLLIKSRRNENQRGFGRQCSLTPLGFRSPGTRAARAGRWSCSVPPEGAVGSGSDRRPSAAFREGNDGAFVPLSLCLS